MTLINDPEILQNSSVGKLRVQIQTVACSHKRETWKHFWMHNDTNRPKSAAFKTMTPSLSLSQTWLQSGWCHCTSSFLMFYIFSGRQISNLILEVLYGCFKQPRFGLLGQRRLTQAPACSAAGKQGQVRSEMEAAVCSDMLTVVTWPESFRQRKRLRGREKTSEENVDETQYAAQIHTCRQLRRGCFINNSPFHSGLRTRDINAEWIRVTVCGRIEV